MFTNYLELYNQQELTLLDAYVGLKNEYRSSDYLSDIDYKSYCDQEYALLVNIAAQNLVAAGYKYDVHNSLYYMKEGGI